MDGEDYFLWLGRADKQVAADLVLLLEVTGYDSLWFEVKQGVLPKDSFSWTDPQIISFYLHQDYLLFVA